MPAERRPRNEPLQEPNLNELFKKELDDALKQVPATKRNDEEMQSVPKLERNDLDDIGWPAAILQWSYYSKYWDSDVEEAAKCKDLNGKIQILEEKVKKTLSEFQTAQAQKEKIELYDENRNCPIQNDKIRDYEYSQFTELPFHWACHQCRTPSDRVLTNWSLMQLIRENNDEARGENNEDKEEDDEDSGEDDEDSDEDDYLNVLRVQMDTPF
ncbi:hypothetical protein CAEBREN_11297 [Caenorhabditis brenneri]|uniref:Uncharacterized protein n=1 Tax=Caenorhabditis brenneri TaxID=135651 RepID=G0NV41_CAEBE|nr:hypothetical protein CAEBREN_11297 [Caenorhabditis brenneri]